MSADFTLKVPADPQFHGLANDVVGRYVELVGVPEGEREAIAAAVSSALEGLGAAPSESVDLTCTAKAAGFDITVRCGARTAVVHHPQPAARR
jgi:hypothetical protein